MPTSSSINWYASSASSWFCPNGRPKLSPSGSSILLNELANRAVAAANISPPAFFRVIEDLSPTLLIDEADTFLNANEALKGILNAGYKRKTAFVFRAVNSDPSIQTTIHEVVPNLGHPSSGGLGKPN